MSANYMGLRITAAESREAGQHRSWTLELEPMCAVSLEGREMGKREGTFTEVIVITVAWAGAGDGQALLQAP